ncbi:prostaglandin reductase 1-like [Rhynchophorus ferrugineus]|uniref:prostaglandin reductase 1-like n=1 Tax=Rhynchophorus ferrugineus TaxID=354439 RepID=UPI003FCD1B8E
MVRAKVFVYDKRFDGLPKEGDLKLIEEELPPIKDGEFLAEALYISVDPYMRYFAHILPIGSTFVGQQIAVITESKNPDYPVGKYIAACFGWRTHTISNGTTDLAFPTGVVPIIPLPDDEEIPKSLGLGVLGMPGNTAYFGFLELCQPKAGETVVVTAAAGAVGSHVGQIAKIKGCIVIGIAGSDDKCNWLKNELNFDHVVNYKTQDIDKTLNEIAPQGVDCYFDNVGGEISSIIIDHMNLNGRISVCGCISGYDGKKQMSPNIQLPMIMKQLRMEGFIVYKWLDRWSEGIIQNWEWIKQGKLKYKEFVTNGFENTFKAFIQLLQGENVGKAIVKV